jgi:hypothetical protein
MAEAITENLWVTMTSQWGFPMRLRIESFAEPAVDRDPPASRPVPMTPANTAELPTAENEIEFIGSTAAVQSS